MELYRYHDANMASGPYISLEKYRVIRETPCCYVIDDYGKTRFVLKDQSGKRFAYATVEGAQNSFKIRKRRQRQHIQGYLNHVEAVCKRIDAGTAFDATKNVHMLSGLDEWE